MTGILGSRHTQTGLIKAFTAESGGDSGGGTIFKGTVNSTTLPTISTSSVPAGKTWIAHGVCKQVEAIAYSTASATSTLTCGLEGGADSGAEGGTSGAADSGTSGAVDSGTSGRYWHYHTACYCAHYCARYCAHYCARYCARYCAHYCGRYCGRTGYGYGFGYGYGSARGYAASCTAIAVNGSSSWTQIIPSGFTITTWLYYEEESNA